MRVFSYFFIDFSRFYFPLFCYFKDARDAREADERHKTEELKEMMLQEIRRRPNGNEGDIIEQERKRRQELYQQQLNERRKSHESLLQVQEQLLKIFAKIKVGWLRGKVFQV